jgi:hypothetical protein
MAFLTFRVEAMQDFVNLHRVLLGYDGQLSTFFHENAEQAHRWHVTTLDRGLRLDIDCTEDELRQLAVHLFCWCVFAQQLLNWEWQDGLTPLLLTGRRSRRGSKR